MKKQLDSIIGHIFIMFARYITSHNINIILASFVRQHFTYFYFLYILNEEFSEFKSFPAFTCMSH